MQVIQHSILVNFPAALETAGGTKDALIGLGLGIVQLVASLLLFTLAVNNGIKLVSRMIEGIDIWNEIKKRNVAVSLLAAGAVIAYTNVVAGGIGGMTKGLSAALTGQVGHGLAALLGGALNLIVALLVAGVAISWTFKIMDRWTTTIDEKEEFKSGNVAIGVVYAGILVGASGLISAGVSGIGEAVTGFFNSIL